MRVLLVEDSATYREQLTHLMEAIPETEIVEAASTAEQACGWIDANPSGWDLAIVDLFLQKGHGFEVLRACQDRLPHQRVVVLTNYTVDPARHGAQAAGADAFFDKSLDIGKLIRFVMEHPRHAGGGRTPHAAPRAS